MGPDRWDKLLAIAQKVVEKTMAELPPDVAEEARQVRQDCDSNGNSQDFEIHSRV